MNIPFTKKQLVKWAGTQVVRDAENLVKRKVVLEANYDPPRIQGSILWNNRALHTSLRILPDGHVENRCPCYTNRERGMVCAHVIALALHLVQRAADPLRERKHMEEQRRAARIGAIDEARYIQRAKVGAPGAEPATLRVTLGADLKEGFQRDAIPVFCEIESRHRRCPLDQAPRTTRYALAQADEALLFVLEDISGGPACARLELTPFDFLNVLHLLKGRALDRASGPSIAVHSTPAPASLKISLDDATGMLELCAQARTPVPADESALYIVAGRNGWLYTADHLWPLDTVLPLPYHAVYEAPVRLPREQAVRFMMRELPRLAETIPVDTTLSADMFTVEPAAPKFRLDIKGSPASLSATLHARYAPVELVAGKPDAREPFAIPDPDDLFRYTGRHLAAEKKALAHLSRTGFQGEVGDALSSIVGKRHVLNFLGGHLPALRRLGWQVDIRGRVAAYMESLDFATPVVHIDDPSPESSWFEVGFDFEDRQGQSLSPSEVQLAIRKGEAFLQKNGRTVLVDTDMVESMGDVFSDCASGEAASAGKFRLNNVYAPFVKSSLDALDGVDIEDTPAWRQRARQYNRQERIEPVVLCASMERTLRPYQKEGVQWLYFLDRNGFNGILADEMGLGKTVQTLAWIQHRRQQASATRPALIVCPTSMVENWAEEIAQFVPDLQCLILTGAEREKKRERLAQTDIAITSYAILRRDLDAYVAQPFSLVALDEAQHIKNRSTQNAVAAKSLNADRKLVLTGTPVENSVSDLWSIMDFLMPGFLGSHEHFREKYERPVSRNDAEGELAQTKLRRKLHPFLLRRLKSHVARDLPEKIHKIASCSLSADQRVVYEEILKNSRRKISDLVATHGFQRARMQILATLMRLRQACCHLDLLKLPGLHPQYPSAKMELFFELLDEAMDGDHRVLVFSQFTTMLKILRDEIDARGLRHCYLDGATKNRMDVVRQFNGRPDIPVFLISLKAGGVGLNLTGADTVVHFDPWWNPAVEDQATDRAHRIGQKKTVYCLKLITKNTVEEKVLALQKKKQAVIDATISAESADAAVMKSLAWEDIQDILTL